jgi:hypothetical protein
VVVSRTIGIEGWSWLTRRKFSATIWSRLKSGVPKELKGSITNTQLMNLHSRALKLHRWSTQNTSYSRLNPKWKRTMCRLHTVNTLMPRLTHKLRTHLIYLTLFLACNQPRLLVEASLSKIEPKINLKNSRLCCLSKSTLWCWSTRWARLSATAIRWRLS